MIQLSGFGKPESIKVNRILPRSDITIANITRGRREKLENFEKRKEEHKLLHSKTMKSKSLNSKSLKSLNSKSFNSKSLKLLNSKSLNIDQLTEMKYPTLVEHVYGCIEKAEQSLTDVEALLAFSSVAGFEVPADALLAFKLSRGFLKLAKTKKFNLVDAVVDGIGIAMPSARLSGYKQHPALDRGARLLQLSMKKLIKGESIKPINALTVYSAAGPSLTTSKIGASTAGSLARQYAAINGFLPKSKK